MHVLQPYEPFLDERGEIKDLLRDVHLDAVTLIRTHKGCVRGNHIHKDTEQYTYMIEGRVRWRARGSDGSLQEFLVGPGDLVLSPANEAHAMIAEEEAAFLVFTRGPRSGARFESDTYRLEDPLLR
jgi:quercetin dioxygenase-like cupin family protein